MKKKLLVTILSATCALACAFGLTACGENTGTGASHAHVWSQSWESDDAHHWHNCTADGCTVTDNAQKDGYAAHDFTDGNCVCGKEPAPAKTFTVVFDANGGAFDKGELDIGDGETVDDGADISSDGKLLTVVSDAASFSEPLRMPDKAQYAFSGWAKDKEGNTLWDFEKDELSVDMTLYAVWAESFDFVLSEDRSHYIVRGIGALSGDVEIPQTHNRKPVTEIAKEAFKNSRTLTGMIIPDGVTTIGERAFMNATKLESISIGEGVTYLPDMALNNCTSLAVISLPKSLKKIEYTVFGMDGIRFILEVRYAGTVDEWCGIDMDCSTNTDKANPLSNGRAELYIDGSAVNDITVNAEHVNAYAFYGCGTIESVTVGKNVKEIGDKAFFANEIETLSFAADSALTTIGESAFERIKVTELKLPDSVKGVGYKAFYDCSKLTKIDIGGTRTVANEAFGGCFDVSELNLRTAEYLGTGAFTGNSVLNEDGALASVTIPDTVWYIGRGCFGSQPALKSVTFASNASNASWYWYEVNLDETPKTVTSTELSSPTTAANKIKTGVWMRIASELTTSGSTVTGVTNKNGIGVINIPKGITVIAANAFKDFKGLRSLTISDSVTSIGNGFADGCDGLTGISVALNNSSYASRNGIFYRQNGEILWVSPSIGTTHSTGDLRIPSGVKTIPRGMFENRKIWNIVIPETVTSIADRAFENCPIEIAEIPAFAIPYVKNDVLRSVDVTSGTSIPQRAFGGCAALEYAWLPNTLTSIGAWAFENCTSLTSITIPSKVTSIGTGAFSGCAIVLKSEVAKEETIWSYSGVPVIYDSNKNEVASDGYIYAVIDGLRYALKDGEAVVAKQSGALSGQIVLPAKVKYDNKEYAINRIADYAFASCAKITSVSTGAGVTEIGEGAFQSCGSLIKVTISGKVTKVGSYVFGDSNNVIVYCEAQNAQEDWSEYWNTDKYGNKACPIVYDCKKNDKDENGYIYVYSYGLRYVLKDGAASISQPSKTISGELVICSEITHKNQNYFITSIDDKMFENCSLLTSVTIEHGITSIGNSAFNNCGSLTSISIPNSVTSLGNYAFGGCGRLTDVTLPNSIKSIGSSPFGNCNSLNEIEFTGSIEDWCNINGAGNIADKVSINGKLLSKMTQIVIGNGVEKIYGGTFNSFLSSLESVVIGNDTVKICEKAFSYCPSLKTVTFGNSVENIDYNVFYHCDAIESITVAAGNNVFFSQDGILYAKYNNASDSSYIVFIPKALKGDITIPDSVTSIRKSEFANLAGISQITFGKNITSVGADAFRGCTSLTRINYAGDVSSWCVIKGLDNINQYVNISIYIGNEKISDITSIELNNDVADISDYAFSGFSSLKSITLPANLTRIGNNAFENCSSLESITIPDGVRYISESTFSNCRALERVTLPADLIRIGKFAFRNCSSLDQMTIPNSVNEIYRYAFSGCKLEITENGIVYVDNWVVDYDYEVISEHSDVTIKNGTVGIADSAFDHCSLRSIAIPGSVRHIGSSAFYVCNMLESAVIGEGVTELSYSMFESCGNLKNVTIPDSVTIIARDAFDGCTGLIQKENGLSYVGQWVIDCEGSATQVAFRSDTRGIATSAFVGCTKLENINIPEGVKYINASAFASCSSLENITIPDSVISIGGQAFYNCKKLLSIDVGTKNNFYKSIDGNLYTKDGKTLIKYATGKKENSFVIPDSVENISAYAFYECSLKQIVLPEGLKTIKEYAFSYCDFTEIIIPSSVMYIEDCAFWYTTNCTIYCKAEKKPEGWSVDWNLKMGSQSLGTALYVHAVWGYKG